VPDATLAAFRDHGHVARTLDQGLQAAQDQLDAVTALGIDLELVGQDLQVAGLAQFETAYADLLKLV